MSLFKQLIFLVYECSRFKTTTRISSFFQHRLTADIAGLGLGQDREEPDGQPKTRRDDGSEKLFLVVNRVAMERHLFLAVVTKARVLGRFHGSFLSLGRFAWTLCAAGARSRTAGAAHE